MTASAQKVLAAARAGVLSAVKEALAGLDAHTVAAIAESGTGAPQGSVFWFND